MKITRPRETHPSGIPKRPLARAKWARLQQDEHERRVQAKAKLLERLGPVAHPHLPDA